MDSFAFTLLPQDCDKITPYFDRAMRLFPSLGKAPIRHFVNGPESFTPDGLPMIGRAGEIDGLLVATAMNSAGVTWSAMTGTLIDDLEFELLLPCGRRGFFGARLLRGRFRPEPANLRLRGAAFCGLT